MFNTKTEGRHSGEERGLWGGAADKSLWEGKCQQSTMIHMYPYANRKGQIRGDNTPHICF